MKGALPILTMLNLTIDDIGRLGGTLPHSSRAPLVGLRLGDPHGRSARRRRGLESPLLGHPTPRSAVLDKANAPQPGHTDE